ncbi:MAG: type VI secretion lipoprotein TssJ [Nitrospinae bacterium]|nr:type VI secretion lipoprotein TssJ [Nitrospinota bacterium]
MTLNPCGSSWRSGARRRLALVGALACALLASSCSLFSSKPDEPDWTFGADAIFLQFKADTNLNLYDREPHTVAVGLFQLDSPNAFQNLVATADGASQLLSQGKVDKSVLSFDRFFIPPGGTMTQVFDRLEGAKFVGLVIGYFDLSRTARVSVFKPVPTGEVQEGFLFTTGKAQPTLLWLRVGLGSDGVVSVEQLSQADAEAMQKKQGAKGADGGPAGW